MAKNQSYYFSHDINASNDPKIAAMISELGMISYAWWWILIEKLAAADDYKLPLKKYTFVALDNELKMNDEQILTSVQHVFNKNQHVLNKSQHVLEQNEHIEFCSFLLIYLLIHDYELLDCDDEYFWSPSLIRRFEFKKVKEETIREKRRLAGLKSVESRKAKKQNLTHVQQNLTHVQQNQLIKEKKRKENNIERDTRAREDENPLSMFNDDEEKNKPIYELYMKSIGVVSPTIKERLDDLVESYGKERVIVAINTTADNGGNSIKYVETVTAGNLKKEVNKDFGTTKRNSSNRGYSRKDEQVDWQAEYERVHGRK
ncbi:DUF4373 domain-containing protein [Veillonella nakazawae]|uniref:Lin1244/Lin1753 domain-containing protein n=1 Tax=Veillonella nakazawae TaxID=2682456 RepID=UPI00352E8450